MKLLFLIVVFYLFKSGDFGYITTWAGDPTGDYCKSKHFEPWKCDGNDMDCSAPMRDCNCKSKALEKAGRETHPDNLFKTYCNSVSIDGKIISHEARARCLNCQHKTCDQPEAPSCETMCNRSICINGWLQTVEMDSCPKFHQKNVAKCCMWGNEDPSYCACVTMSTLDINGAAMNKLRAAGNSTCRGSMCTNVSWKFGTCSSNSRPSNAVSVGGKGSCKNENIDEPPPTAWQFSCQEQARWGKCNQTWMKGYCCKSCNPNGRITAFRGNSNNGGDGHGGRTCSGKCSDEQPPTARQFSCQQQAQWGKCREPWMNGFCCKSCNPSICGVSRGGRSACTDVHPPGAYTCQQQKQWRKCMEPWMQGYCNRTCGRCS